MLYAQGRAADPDTTAAISVRMTVDGTSVRTFLAQVGYPADVPVPPDLRDRFSELVPVGAVRWPGRTVCLTALNAGPGADTDLGCRTAVPDETFVEAQCGTSWEYDGPPRSPILGSAADGIAPLALQEDAPVGDPIGASSNAIGFVRCIAQRTGRAVGAVFAGGEAWALEIVAPDVALPPGTTTVEFGNATAGGKWIVAHRTGFGEVASGWRAPFQKDERVVWRLSRSERGDGSFVADTIGFVKLAPWAVGVASFPPAIFWELADGMILHFRWA